MPRERLTTVDLLSFDVLEIVLHVREVEVGASRPTEYVEHVGASRLKVARRVVRLRQKYLPENTHHNRWNAAQFVATSASLSCDSQSRSLSSPLRLHVARQTFTHWQR